MIQIRSSIVTAVVLTGTFACSDPSSPGSDPIDALPRQLTAAEQKLVAGNNTFAFGLLRQVNTAQATQNVFISPLSASMALGMAANGAGSTTWEAMRGTLGLGTASREEIGEGYKSLIALLRGLDESTDFRIANSIWYDKTFPFSQSFLTESESYFDAEVAGLDFDSPASLGTINGWVSDATEKKIPKIVESLDGDEVMNLINAIHFKGTWKDRFDKSKTTNAPFFAADGSSTNVPMMYQPGPIRVAQTENLTAVDLQYGNTAYSMTVVLPNEGVNINTVVAGMTQASWEQLTAAFSQRNAPLYFPRFKLTWEKKLNDDLTALGMGVAFDPTAANFSRMSPEIDVYISDVIQKTFIEVDEEGTEAAAVTSVGVVPTSAPQPVRVDRPFILVIRERLSGTILFMGKIMKLPA
jgi:serine protease inhibitor